jgi:hypothetical protein
VKPLYNVSLGTALMCTLMRGQCYGKSNRIPSGICWGSSEFLLRPIDGANVRETPPLLTAGFETHPRRSGNSLPVSRSACVVSCYASRFRTNLMYQPHTKSILPLLESAGTCLSPTLIRSYCCIEVRYTELHYTHYRDISFLGHPPSSMKLRIGSKIFQLYFDRLECK